MTDQRPTTDDIAELALSALRGAVAQVANAFAVLRIERDNAQDRAERSEAALAAALPPDYDDAP